MKPSASRPWRGSGSCSPAWKKAYRWPRSRGAHGLQLRTAQHWLARYRKTGLSGLARQPRADREHRRLLPALQHLIEGLALRKPPPTSAFVHHQVAAVATQRGWPVPSYACVYAVIRALDPALVALAHDGPKVYSEEFDLIHRREAAHPNAIWQADHTQLDLLLLDERGVPARPWLTVIEDDYSRCIAGYFLAFTAPNAFNTALTLRQAIWRKADPRWHVCGVPAVFYTDHGSDFTSQHLEQVGADLHMQLVFSAPGAPRGRGRIERFFETVNQLFLCRLPGYMPRGHTSATPAPTLPACEAQFREFLLGEYTCGCTARPVWDRRRVGTPVAFYPVCLSRWSNWTSCCSP